VAQALITVNAVPGSNAALALNVLVQLDNQNAGGETTYTWSILDQPPGALDALSSVSVQNPTFTPKKEGSYLLRLIVNQGAVTEQENRVICAVKQLKTLERIPAAGETTEVDSADGWSTSYNGYLRRVDTLLGDPGIFVGVNASGGALARGDVLRATASSIIKSGLPGQETLPGFSKALATTLAQVDEPLVVCEGGVDGSASVASLGLMKVRFLGRYATLTGAGVAVVGDSVYVSDTATMSLTAGTVKRKVGSAMTAGATFDVWYAGMGGEDITPIDRAYVILGAPGTLTNAIRVDGTNATGITTPFRIKQGDAATVGLQVVGFAAGADLQQWMSSAAALMVSVDQLGALRFAIPGILGTSNADAMTFITNGVQRWQVLSTGELISVGGPRAIQSVLDPVTAQDAVTKAYSDNEYRARNAVINGRFDFWQRGTTFTVTPPGTRIFTTDHWYGYGDATADNTVIDQQTTGLPGHTRYALRQQRPFLDVDTSKRQLIQEIDRDVVQNLRGRRTRIVCWVKRGANTFHGTLDVALFTGTGAETENVVAGYTGSSIISGPDGIAVGTGTWAQFTFISSAIVPTTANTMSIVFTHTPTAVAAGADESFWVAGVEVLDAGAAAPFNPIPGEPYIWFGGDLQSDYEACLRYYEKSYELQTAPTAATNNGAHRTFISVLLTANAATWPMGSQPRFKVSKWATPTVTVYDASAGGVNSWDLDAVKASVAGTISKEGFSVLNNTGGNYTPGAATPNGKGHWVAEAEI
jgi:hypothetical protein